MPASPFPRAGRPFCFSALISLATCVSIACGAPRAVRASGDIGRAVESSLASGTATFEHGTWDRLLAAGTRDGLVDYGVMAARRADLDRYLDRVAAAPLDRLAPAHLEALLINAYNALTVRSILDRPGVTSIRDIDGVWSAARHKVGGFDVTLDDLEHRLLRPFFKDPRIHFAVNCASRSCPPLPPWAMNGERVDAQLDELTRKFLVDPRNVRLDRADRAGGAAETAGGVLKLSKIFDWYGGDFTAAGWRGAAPTVAAFVTRYAPPAVQALVDANDGKPPIEFLEYDWSLNRAAPASPAGESGR